MNPSLEGSAAAAGARELARLQEQVEKARAILNGLQQDLIDVAGRLGNTRVLDLVHANEQLVLSTLRAQGEAEASSRSLKAVSRIAELDALTELPNRLLLLDRLGHAIAHARRRSTRLALLFLDLNNFKLINDALGHAAGDAVLKLVAERLATSVRGADTVSRLGGDEFVILLPEVAQSSDAVLIADKIIAALAAPTCINDHELRLTASIGVSVYPEDAEDAAALIDRADAAMYRAKRHGLGSFVFDPAEGDARSAEPAPFAPHRQPLDDVDVADNGYEAREAQLREANEQLVLAALKAQSLQGAAEEAQRRQADFLGVLAHELRNPLAPIRAAAALLNRVRGDEPMLPRMQAVIERQVEHLSRLIEDLLDVSRAHSGKLRLVRDEVDLRAVIETAVDACRPAIELRSQRLEIRLPAGPLALDGDPVRLAQIVINLLDNASKYTPETGEICLTVDATGDTIALTVSDTGIGIGASSLPHIFDAFAQDRRAVDFNGTGLGIGLSVVRELVEAHGGSVVASSAGINQGSRFVVTLPRLAGAL